MSATGPRNLFTRALTIAIFFSNELQRYHVCLIEAYNRAFAITFSTTMRQGNSQHLLISQIGDVCTVHGIAGTWDISLSGDSMTANSKEWMGLRGAAITVAEAS
jgi:hypothetical protein